MKTHHAVILGVALVLAVGIHAVVTSCMSPYNVCVRNLEERGVEDAVEWCARLLRRTESGRS